LFEKAALDLLPAAHPDRQQALVSTAWSVVHGYAMLTLEGELPACGTQQSGRKLLRHSLHLLLDQFATEPTTKI
jgi:hypothetical protein